MAVNIPLYLSHMTFLATTFSFDFEFHAKFIVLTISMTGSESGANIWNEDMRTVLCNKAGSGKQVEENL